MVLSSTAPIKVVHGRLLVVRGHGLELNIHKSKYFLINAHGYTRGLSISNS